jgi:dihydroorotase
MKFILREAKVIDAKSPFNNKTVDILVVDGFIKKIAVSLPNSDETEEIKLDNLHVSQGWFDSSVSLGEPGYEDRETIVNGLSVAAKSGFTAIALQPNSFPVIDNQAQVNFVQSKASGSATQLFSIGALTKGSEGKDMAELYDMTNCGAIAFGDYNKSQDNANLLKIALQYVQDFDGLVIAFPQDEKIKGYGVVNEGVVSTRLGLKGIPNLAEELQIVRNLFLLEYTGGKLHIPTISTAKSVQLIKEAKSKGLKVTCSVAVHHLVLTDEKLEGFDTRFKVSPPLRTQQDRKALLQGVLDNTIDMITSDHNPIDIEHKKMEFDTAKEGTIGLESAFCSLMTVLPLEKVVEKLTLFNPEGKGVFTKTAILSKSKNSALLGTETKGKVHGIVNQGQLILA